MNFMSMTSESVFARTCIYLYTSQTHFSASERTCALSFTHAHTHTHTHANAHTQVHSFETSIDLSQCMVDSFVIKIEEI